MEQQIVDGIIRKLKEGLVSDCRDIGDLQYRKAEYTGPETYTFLTDYQPLTRTELFTGCNTVFVKGMVTFPAEIRTDESCEDFLFLRFYNLAGIVFVDGEPYNGIDENRDRIPLKKEWAGQTKELLIEGYCLTPTYDLNNMPPTCLAYAYFGRVDKRLEKFIFDLSLAKEWYQYDCAHPQADNLAIRKRISAAFDAAIRELDVSLTGEALCRAVERADGILLEQLAAIEDGNTRPHFSMVASSHVDVAWLWQLKDTIRKCGHSFSNVLRLMDSYPEFTFSNSQVKLLAYTKQYYPALYEQIKAAAKAGKWENVGPMWVESDCNVVSGESLVRQILYGVDFLEKEFGSRSRVAWLPDTFGFQPNLPQIFKKSGTDYFYTWKIHWQAQEKFPYGDFRWKGIDGSELLCAVINNSAGCYNGEPNPYQIRGTAEAFEQRGQIDEVLFPFGYGDGGGGPTREMIEYAKRLTDYPGMPTCEITTAQGFFDRLEKIRDSLPLWYGELYLQTHRGTLSSVAEVKKENRRCEMLYQSLEKLAVMAQLCGAKPDWQLLKQGWEIVLVLQFHDILPGTSIDPVYADCRQMYQEAYGIADRFLASLGVGTAVQPGEPVRVVNTLSWDADVLASFSWPLEAIGNGSLRITADGEAMPIWLEKQADAVQVTFLAKAVKAMGYRDFTVIAVPEQTCKLTMQVTEGPAGITVENDRYLAVVDDMGRLVSLLDKREQRQVLSAPGNAVRFFLDGPGVEDAWNLYENYKNREVSLFESTHVALAENNDLCTVIRVHNRGKRIDFAQDIIFWHHNNRIDFKTRVDWQEENKIMRVYFPTTMNAPYFTSEVGFGAYNRPAVSSTKFEKSKFEVVAHRWVDISENGYGVALLNDSRYAHDVQYDTIGLTLLRSTAFPAHYPDKGIHEFTYSLLPHSGSWDQAGVARAGMELNAQSHTVRVIGCCQLAAGLVSCDQPNLVIDTVKQAENGKGFVIRLYEANGTSANACLTFGRKVRSVAECDLTEKPLRQMDVHGDALRFAIKPYEIITYLVDFEQEGESK